MFGDISKGLKKFKTKKWFTLLLILILIILGIFLINNTLINKKNDQLIVNSYQDCIKDENSYLVDSYPKQCISNDLVTYIEPVTEPVDRKSVV